MNDTLSTGHVKSSLRTLLIFELFASEQKPLSLAEISRSLDMAKSSGLALLNTLTARGYLYKATPDGKYYPTRRWLSNASRVAEYDHLAGHIHACLERLSRDSGETAIHAVLAGDQSVYVDVVESGENIRFSTRSGDTKPLPISASGRAQLGVLPPEQMETIVGRMGLTSTSKGLGLTPKSLTKLILDERERGWSCNLGDFRSEVCSAAVGLNLNGAAHALVVAAPLARASPHIEKIGQMLVREVEILMKQLL